MGRTRPGPQVDRRPARRQVDHPRPGPQVAHRRPGPQVATRPANTLGAPPVPYSLSSLSLEYVRLPVSAKDSGVVVNPTSDAVAMAFIASGAPAGGDWKTYATTTPPNYYACCLVGPAGTVTLAPGTYMIWLKITDTPEIPARAVAPLIVT